MVISWRDLYKFSQRKTIKEYLSGFILHVMHVEGPVHGQVERPADGLLVRHKLLQVRYEMEIVW